VTNSTRRFFSLAGTALLAVSSIAVCSSMAIAGSLPVGGLLIPVPGAADVGGSLVATIGPQPFITPTFSGTLLSSVYSGDTSNPYDPTGTLGLLTFTYVLSNNISSPDGIERMEVSSFDPFLTDVSYKTPNSGLVPEYADRATSATVGFSFDNAFGGAGPLNPGLFSALLVVHTDSTVRVAGMASIIDSHTGTAMALVPTLTAPPLTTPEPASIVLFGLGILAMLFVARRKRRRVTA
jgi:PEP-CTERM motif